MGEYMCNSIPEQWIMNYMNNELMVNIEESLGGHVNRIRHAKSPKASKGIVF